MTKFAKRLEKHFAAVALASAIVGVYDNKADAALVYSGAVNIAIPDNIDGIYMNVVTGATGTSSAVTGWDINPYSALAGGFYLWGPTTNTWFGLSGGTQFNLPVGTLIGPPATNFFRPGGSLDLVAAGQINLNSSNNLFGFQFVNEAAGNQTQYGWMRVQFGASGSIRSIVEYAYGNAGEAVQAGVVPAPGAFALLGLAGLAGSRRRRS